jgi:hypothetical protein
MEKFVTNNTGIDSLVRSNSEATSARFGHLNAIVENLNTLISKYTTIVSAEQAATLKSSPVELNVPEGIYSFIGGYIYYPPSATVIFEINGPSIYNNDQAFIICKSNIVTIDGNQILTFDSYISDVNRPKSSKVYLTSSEDATEAPDAPIEVTLYLTKLNLSII